MILAIRAAGSSISPVAPPCDHRAGRRTSRLREAADLSLTHGLAMADSLVYATARRFGATLVTGDADFEGLADAVVVR
jgi:predicted nucleic acid-binding protein